MRRSLVGLTAFLALTGTFVVLPVYAAPAPEAKPVETSIDTVELGSLDAPAPVADVAPAEKVQPDVVGTVPDGAPTEAEPVAASDPVLTVSRPDVDRFSAVGVTWAVDPDVTDVKVRLRTKDGDGGWSEWSDLAGDDSDQTASPETSPEDARSGTAPYWTGPSTGVEVQLTAASGAQPQDVELDLIDPGKSAADAVPGAPAAKDQAHAATGMPPVYSRAQWGADESIRTWDPEYAPTIKAATLHHTADGNGYTAAQVPAILRSIYSYHAQSRGWGDIGYNVLVDKFGRIWEGRYGGLSSTVIGAHAGGFNTGTFGVSMMGNYSEVDTPAVMMDAVAAIMAWKLGLYGVDPNGVTQLVSAGGGTAKYAAGTPVYLPTIFGHRDVGNTECPGNYAYSRMGELRSAVAARIAPPSGSPIGNLESFTLGGGNVVTAVGWTFDPDNPTGTVPVDLLIDGVPAVEWQANGVRGDVGAVYPAAGANHGFSASHPLPLGEHSICVVALNIGATGGHNWMACRQMVAKAPPPAINPFGNVEGISVDGRTISTRGWTIDPDAQTSSLAVHVYVDGGWGGAVVADGNRPDVAAVYPAAGPAHGFSWSLQVSAPGDYRVCVFAINQNAGTTNPQLGCGTVRVAASSWDPRGHADSADLSGPTVTLSGWALDEDTPTTPLDVHVYVDGRFTRSIKADRSRPDVGSVFPGTGTDHGYSTSLDLAPGVRWVCLYAINTGNGATNPLLGCHAVTVAMAAYNPFGNLDEVQRVGGVVNVSGWAIDPDTWDQPVQVHLYVDGRGYPTVVTADRQRPDVGAVFPGAGPAHGYTGSIALPPGRQTICAYAINVGYGTHNPLMTCRTLPG